MCDSSSSAYRAQVRKMPLALSLSLVPSFLLITIQMKKEPYQPSWAAVTSHHNLDGLQ